MDGHQIAAFTMTLTFEPFQMLFSYSFAAVEHGH